MSLTLIFVLVTVAASYAAWKNENLMQKWIFNPYVIRSRKEYFRFITSGFIHRDTLHLLFNMFVFYMFGEYVERQFVALFGSLAGKLYFVLLYVGGIIISDIPTFYKYRNAPYYNALGASGGVSSVLFSFVIFRPLDPLCLYGLPFLCFPGILWALLYLVYSAYAARKGLGNINHDAHFYGAVFGILITLILYPPIIGQFIEQMKELF